VDTRNYDGSVRIDRPTLANRKKHALQCSYDQVDKRRDKQGVRRDAPRALPGRSRTPR